MGQSAPDKPFQPSLMFVGKARAYLSEAPERDFSLGQASALTKIRLARKSLPGTNTSLLRKFINYGRKRFYSIGLTKFAFLGQSFVSYRPSIGLGNKKSLTVTQNKLERLSLLRFLRASLVSVSKSGNDPLCRNNASGSTCKYQTSPNKITWTNTLAYFASPAVAKKKSFMTLSPEKWSGLQISDIS